jgi:RsiW-degrading membrane proteinase PrsW (M82 family)
MSFVHIAQLLLLYVIAKTCFPFFFSKIHFTKQQVILFAIVFAVFYYLLVYNKARWNRYIEEFKDESPAQRRKGTILVGLFTIGSVVLLFVCMITLSVIFWPSRS